MRNNSLNGIFGQQKFDDPFLMYSNDFIPETLGTALDYSRYLYFLNPQYRRASQRVVRHFVTDFDFPGKGSSTEKSELYDYIVYNLKLPSVLMEMGDDWSCYGNAFYRIYFPFDRFLEDKRSGNTVWYSMDMFGRNIEFDLDKLQYIVPDPRDTTGKRKVALDFIDRPVKDKERIKPVRIDPRQIFIEHDFFSNTAQYVYRFENHFVQDIKSSKIHQINATPRRVLEAIRNDEDYLFNKDAIFHFKAPTISGISNSGWGIPEPIANFRALYQLQVYRKIDEAVGLDYLVPFRLFTPAASDNMSDIFNNIMMSRWESDLKEIVRNRRRDKTSIHTLPYPVTYQEFGAEGKHLTTKDHIEYMTNEVLDSAGYPAELFRGTLQIQQIPTSIRLFENSHWFIHENFTNFCRWTLNQIHRYLGLEPIAIKLQLPSVADDLDTQNVLLQLGMQGEIPRSHFLRKYGIDDPVGAIRERMEEDMEAAEIEQELNEEFERKMEAKTMMQQSGQFPAGQEGDGMTPGDIEEEAQIKAEEWLSIASDGERTKAMNATKVQNFNLYSLAKEIMEQIRRQGASDGRQQVNQQYQGG